MITLEKILNVEIKIWNGFLTKTTENSHFTFHLGAIGAKKKGAIDKNSQVSNNKGEKSFTNQVNNKFIVCLTLFVSR